MELYTVGLIGTVATTPEPYRNIYGRSNVYAFYLDVVRDSGTVDRILVLFQQARIDGDSFGAELGDYDGSGKLASLIKAGSLVEVSGAIQTYKNMESGRMQLFVWGLYIAQTNSESRQNNTVFINGEIAKQPIYRETPKGRRITDIAVRVPSIFAPGFYSFIPCITWERLADQAAELEEGAAVYLEGRLQSREYTKCTPEGDNTLTTWEVSVNKLESRGQDNGN